MGEKTTLSLSGAFITLMLFDPVEVYFCRYHATVCAQLMKCDLCQTNKVYNGFKTNKQKNINKHAVHIYFEIR